MKKLIIIVLLAGFAIAAIGDRFTITNDNGTVQYFNIDKDGDISVAGEINAYGRSEAQLKALTPNTIGAMYFDSTNLSIVIATGTVSAGSFAIIYDSTTVPNGW